MKTLFAFLVFIAIAAGSVWLVWFKPPKPEPPEAQVNPDVSVQTGKILRTTLHGYVTAYGRVEPASTASARVAASVPGVISAVKCVEGQPVEKGTILFELDSHAADVAINFAQKNFERQEKLSKVEGTSVKTFQDAEQQLATANAQKALLQIRAPIAGVITHVNVKPGEAEDLTTVLAELIDVNQLVVNASVPTGELASLKTDQPAEVTSTDSTNMIKGTVAYIGSQVDPKSGTAPVRIALSARGGFRPGQSVLVRIVSDEHKDCLAVPAASVGKDPTGSFFIAKVAGEKAMLVRVKVGLREGDMVEVEADDLQADMPIVTEGAYGLVMAQQDATRIRIQNQ